MIKLPCSRQNVLELAHLLSVDNYTLPISFSLLKQLGGRGIVNHFDLWQAKHSCIRINETDEELRIELWNWPKQRHHSTLIIYPDNQCEIVNHRRNHGEYSIFWKYFLTTAYKKNIFKFPKEVNL